MGTNKQSEGEQPKSPARVDGDAEIAVSKDRMTATGIITPAQGSGTPVLSAGVIHRLRSAGVVYGIMEEAIQQLIEQSNVTGEVTRGVVASGRPMKPASPPVFEMLVNMSETLTSTAEKGAEEKGESGARPKSRARKEPEDEGGRVDYHFLAPIPAVEEGQIIAVKRPGFPGEAGRTVLDEPVEPTPARDEHPRPAAGVKTEEDADGSIRYIAALAGKVEIEDGKRMRVVIEHLVQGDVTMATGDVAFPGDVVVRGDVGHHAVIRARGNVTVMGQVGGATIEAGGNVSVSRGIIGGGHGIVQAGGKVSATFAEGATIEARGDVEIRRGVMNSDISASGGVTCMQGRGAIIGGVTRAGKVVEAKSIGSQAGAETHLIVGTDFALLRERAQLEEAVSSCNEIIRKLDHALGPLDLDSDLSSFPEERRQSVRKAARERIRQRALLRTLEDKLTNVKERMRTSTGGAVRVMGTCQPGTKVTIRNSHLVLTDEVRFCQLVENPEDGTIQSLSLY